MADGSVYYGAPLMGLDLTAVALRRPDLALIEHKSGPPVRLPAPTPPSRLERAIAAADAAGHQRLAAAIVQTHALLSRLTSFNPEVASRDTLAALAAADAIEAAELAWKHWNPWAEKHKMSRVADLILHLSFAKAAIDRGAPVAEVAAAKAAAAQGWCSSSAAAWELAIRSFKGVPEGWGWVASPKHNGAALPRHRPKRTGRDTPWDQVVFRLLEGHEDQAADVAVDGKLLRDQFMRWLKDRTRTTQKRD